MTAPKPTAEDFKTQAVQAGFDECRITVAKELDGYQRLLKWLAAGYDGSMAYIRNRAQAYRHPHGVLPGTNSVVILVSSYHFPDIQHRSAKDAVHGKVARYAASGLDYHDVLHDRMQRMITQLRSRWPTLHFRGVVDSAPILEREFAQQAGIGWIGKNTMLISRKWGSYFFLSALLTDAELQPDPVFESDHCGSCRACLDACPTQAFVEPHVLDATKCISYLTIENRDAPSIALRQDIGDWLFGCDVCQEVCPWNRKAVQATSDNFLTKREMLSIDLEAILRMNEEEFRSRYRKTPLWRAKLVGIQRNALIAMTNQRHVRTQHFAEEFISHPSTILRLVAAWSLRQIATETSWQRLRDAVESESDLLVAEEMRTLLS